MGDTRFMAPYQRVKKAANALDEIQALSDEDVIAALSAAAAEKDPYVSNVLTTEAQNRVTRYSAIVTTMAEGVFTVGPMGRLTAMNPAAERTLGWTWREAQGMDMDGLLGCTVQGPDGRARPRALCAETLQAIGPTHEEEALFTRRDGTRFPAAYSAAPIVRDGDTRGAVVVFRDITERRRTEEDVRRLAAIVQASDDSILSLSLDGTILTWNPRAEEIYGYPASYAIGRHATLVVPPELRDAYRRILARVGAGETVRHHETQRIRRGGKVIDISLTAAPIRNAMGDIAAISWIGHDITEAKRHEEALRHSQEQYRLLLDSVTDHAIFLLDPRGYVMTWNPAAERIKGWKEKEIVGWHYSILFPPEEVARGDPWTELEDAVREGRHDGEERRIRKDGRLFDASITLSAMRDDEGKLVGFVKVTRDVSERKAWERRLQTGEERYNRLFDLNPQPMAWCDPSGSVVRANEAFAGILGFAMESLVGRPLASLCVPENQGAVEREVEAIKDGAQRRLSFTAVPKDGEHVLLACRLVPIVVDGMTTGFFAVAESAGPPRTEAPRSTPMPEK